MEDIFIKLKGYYSQLRTRFLAAEWSMRLIYINVGLFLLLRIVMFLGRLFHADSYFNFYFSLPSSLETFFTRVWTLFTYMFIHEDLMHLLMNMLCLYWFSMVFRQFFTERQLVGVYISGGLTGGLLYLFACNLFPSYHNFLIGASASILALLVASAYYAPTYRVQLIFFGNVTLKMVAIVWVAFDLLSVTSGTSGGHWAHLGGVLYGLFFGYYAKKGKDLTRWVQSLTDVMSRFATPKKAKPKVKMSYQDVRRESDGDYNARKARESKEIDQILDKIKQSGYDSLTKEEKQKLFEAGSR